MNLLEVIIFFCIFGLMSEAIYSEIISQKRAAGRFRQIDKKLATVEVSSCTYRAQDSIMYRSCRLGGDEDVVSIAK